MKRVSMILSLWFVSVTAFAEVRVGSAAPVFSEKDGNGKIYSLSDYKGKWVVLEWYNKDCPYVKKHYGSGNMQSLQKAYASQNVTWLTVISSAEGKQGYLAGAEAIKNAKDTGSNATAVLIDSDGNMGKAYDAKTTPHMFIINPEGKVVYAGAIDDNDSANPKVIASSKNYVKMALDASMKGQPVETSSTKPYGCGVKYN